MMNADEPPIDTTEAVVVDAPTRVRVTTASAPSEPADDVFKAGGTSHVPPVERPVSSPNFPAIPTCIAPDIPGVIAGISAPTPVELDTDMDDSTSNGSAKSTPRNAYTCAKYVVTPPPAPPKHKNAGDAIPDSHSRPNVRNTPSLLPSRFGWLEVNTSQPLPPSAEILPVASKRATHHTTATKKSPASRRLECGRPGVAR
jgi:hypothetical protein